MNIFIMRHGEAEVMANSDKARRLTAYGIKQAFSQGEWLKQHLSTLVINSLDRILVSPYVRAQETFHQVNQAFDLELEKSLLNCMENEIQYHFILQRLLNYYGMVINQKY